MPWAIAAFVTMVFVIPFDAIELPVSLPFDSKLDRIALGGLVVVWVGQFLLAPAKLSTRPTLFTVALVVFLAVSALGLVANLDVTHRLGESTRGVKICALLLTYAIFVGIVVTSIRPSEIRSFVSLALGLGTIVAVGTIIEYRTETNIFYDFARDVFGGFATVGAPPLDPKFGRPTVVGPGIHALVPVTLLGMVIPFAVLRLLRAETRNHQLLYLLITGLMLAGTVSTLRKSSFIVPVAAVLLLLLYEPRRMLKMAPLGLVLIVVMQVAAPGAAVSVKAQFSDVESRNTTKGRTSDYEAIRPDVLRYPLLGRGMGTYDPIKYRILDNQYLGTLVNGGILGLLAYIGLILAALVTAHSVVRRGPPERKWLALGASAGVAAYAACNPLFDVLSFPQVPYVFFLLAAMIVVLSTEHRLGRLARRTPLLALEPGWQTAATTVAASVAGQRHNHLAMTHTACPDLSIITVTHNGVEMALQTLRSAHQAFGDLDVEWLVVDSGSVDGTPDRIAEEFPGVRLYRRPNIGFAAGNNVAIPDARGRYLLLLNPDVTIREGSFEQLITAMDDRPEVGLATVVQELPDGSVHASLRRFPTASRKLGEALFAPRWPIGRQLQEADTDLASYEKERKADWVVGAFMLARREAVADVGLMDERFFLYSEEIDWCYRFHNAGWQVRHLPVMRIVHYGASRPRPELVAQLSYAKLQYANKHFRPAHRKMVRFALALRHTVRLMAVAPTLPFSPARRLRARGEMAALAVVTRLRKPPFAGHGAR